MADRDLLLVLISIAQLFAWGMMGVGLSILAALTIHSLRSARDRRIRAEAERKRLLLELEAISARRAKASKELKDSLDYLCELQLHASCERLRRRRRVNYI